MVEQRIIGEEFYSNYFEEDEALKDTEIIRGENELPEVELIPETEVEDRNVDAVDDVEATASRELRMLGIDGLPIIEERTREETTATE